MIFTRATFSKGQCEYILFSTNASNRTAAALSPVVPMRDGGVCSALGKSDFMMLCHNLSSSFLAKLQETLRCWGLILTWGTTEGADCHQGDCTGKEKTHVNSSQLPHKQNKHKHNPESQP